MASMTRRAARRLAGGCALLLGAVLSGCAAPQYTDVSVSGPYLHFKISRSWHQVSGSSLVSAMKAEGVGYGGGAWIAAYEAAPVPRASDFLSFGTGQPFVFAELGQLNSATRGQVTDAFLRDFWLPVTAPARQQALAQGFPLTGFRQVRDQVLTLGQGLRGFRETFDYTQGAHADTFDEDVLTNVDQTLIFVLVAHCTTICYGNYQTQIKYMLSSVTVSGVVQPRPRGVGLIGR
ncbi:MAG: hypothetical protein ACRDOD_11135 [Streptosporangiaceae bacterium]